MKIEHLAVWTNQLEALKAFYVRYFNGRAGNKYHNPVKQFSSYFLSFGEGARLELMQRPDITGHTDEAGQTSTGWAHLAFSTGSKEGVDALTETLRQEGFAILDGPRWTGDGYYESVVADPDKNRVEITI